MCGRFRDIRRSLEKFTQQNEIRVIPGRVATHLRSHALLLASN